MIVVVSLYANYIYGGCDTRLNSKLCKFYLGGPIIDCTKFVHETLKYLQFVDCWFLATLVALHFTPVSIKVSDWVTRS